MFDKEELQDFLQKKMYCQICGKLLGDFDKIHIDKPFDLKNVTMSHATCYKNSNFLRKD